MLPITPFLSGSSAPLALIQFGGIKYWSEAGSEGSAMCQAEASADHFDGHYHTEISLPGSEHKETLTITSSLDAFLISNPRSRAPISSPDTPRVPPHLLSMTIASIGNQSRQRSSESHSSIELSTRLKVGRDLGAHGQERHSVQGFLHVDWGSPRRWYFQPQTWQDDSL